MSSTRRELQPQTVRHFAADMDANRNEVERLLAEIDRLHREVSDSQNALLTATEHGDLLQDHLYRLSNSLAAEIRERQAVEEKLRRLIEAVERERGDLEIMVQILIDQGDSLADDVETARIDGLTKIPNRRRLDEFLAKEWKRHAATRQPLSLLILDVDHFKLFNDFYGHPVGDECLKEVARAIKECLRPDDLVARYGGEEFAVVLPHTPSPRAVQIAEKVQQALAAVAIPHEASPVSTQVTVSIGVACRTPDRRPAAVHTLIEEADRNLYIAKHRGRNCVAYQVQETTSQC